MLHVAPPVVTNVALLHGLANESVTLEVEGTNLGLACSVCLAADHTSTLPYCPGSLAPTPQSCDLLNCAPLRSPSVVIAADGSSAGIVACLPVCVDASTSTAVDGESSVIRCRTTAPIARGNINVTVGGQSHAGVPYDYEMMLPTPTLSSEAAPFGLSSAGGVLGLSGTNLGSSGDVFLMNDMGVKVLTPSLYNSTYCEVTLPAGQGMVGLRVRVMGTTTVTNTITYSYGAPTLASASPTAMRTDGDTVITLLGANFGIDLDSAYASRVATLGQSESVAARGSWQRNQVILTSAGVSVNCSVQSVGTQCHPMITGRFYDAGARF